MPLQRLSTRQSYVLTHAFAAIASGVTFGVSAWQMSERAPSINPRFCTMAQNPLAAFTILKPVQVLNDDGSEAALCSWPDRNTTLRMTSTMISLIFSAYGFFASWSTRPIHVLLSLFMAFWWTMLGWAMMLMDASTLVMVQENWKGTSARISVTPFVVIPCLGGAVIITWTAVCLIGWRWCKELVLEPEAGEMAPTAVTTLGGEAAGERQHGSDEEEGRGPFSWFSRGEKKEKAEKPEKPKKPTKGFVLGENVQAPPSSAAGAGWAAGLPGDTTANPSGAPPAWFTGAGAGPSAAPAAVEMQAGARKATTEKDELYI